MTFVIIGGGPTGVELAGAMSEIARTVIDDEFRSIDPAGARVVLIEGGPRLLPSMPKSLSARSKRDLESLGVEVHLDTLAVAVDAGGVTAKASDQEDDDVTTRFDASSVFWGAGVRAALLAEGLGAETDRMGRVGVEPDLSVDGHPEVFVVGDIAGATIPRTDEPVPRVAQGAIQGGRHVGRLIAAAVRGESGDRAPFHYRDKGQTATIGRSRAVADLGWARFGGFIAWAMWSLVHVMFLVGFRNKLLVMADWIDQYVSFGRGARLITGSRRAPGASSPATPPPQPSPPH